MTSPNSGSLIITDLTLQLRQNLFELGMIGMLTRQNDWSFGVGWTFESLDAVLVDGFGLFDRLELVLEAHANRADVGLNPDQSRGVAGSPEDFAELAAVFLSIVAAFDDEGGASLSHFRDEEKDKLTREVVLLL